MIIDKVNGNFTYLMGDSITLFNDIRNLGNLPSTISIDGILGILVTEGKAHISLNGHYVDIVEGDFLLCYPKIVFADTLLTVEFQLCGVYLSPKIVLQLNQQLKSTWKLRTAFDESYVFHFNQADRDAFTHMFDFLMVKANDQSLPNPDEVLSLIFKGVATEFIGRLDKYLTETLEEPASSTSPSANLIFNRFTHLLETSPQKLQPISWWASQLNITPKYLSFICRSLVGKPASVLIQNAIILEANVLLQNPNLSIKQIADRLGFANQSHFGTFYKRHTGTSPMAKR